MKVKPFARAQKLSRLAVITKNPLVWQEAMKSLRRAVE